MKKRVNNWKGIMFRVLVVALFALFLIGIIGYARGYRLDFKQKSLTATGIIAVNSYPQAAKVYIKDPAGNYQLKGATSINLNLPPGTYTVEIKKDGYTGFTKTITLKGELVQSVDALLFPINPSLTPLTNLGIVSARQVDQTDKVILFSQNDPTSGQSEKDGIYLFDAGKKGISFLPPLTLLALKTSLPAAREIDFKENHVYFSYDFKQAILEFNLIPEVGAPVQTPPTKVRYLLSLDQENQTPFEVTNSYETLLSAWGEEKQKETTKILEAFPQEIKQVASDSFHIVAVSPDKTKVFYQATKNIELPLVINPPLIAANQSPEVRSLTANSYYVYDKKEDKNFNIDIKYPKSATLNPKQIPSPNSQPSLNTENLELKIPLWYPDSKHFVLAGDKQILVIDYDGQNKQPVYSGPYDEGFIGVDSDGKLLILSNLNPQANKLPDLYSVGIH